MEQHRLTSRERRIVLMVALVAALVLAAWITAIILSLPNTGQG